MRDAAKKRSNCQPQKNLVSRLPLLLLLSDAVVAKEIVLDHSLMGTVSGKSSNKKQMMTGYSRRAHHAGSWYSSNRQELDAQLSGFMEPAAKVEVSSTEAPLRGIICPHAGFSYSGPTAAFSYHALQREFQKPDSPVTHILVLHPSHHEYLDGCAVSGATQLESPLGNLLVDDELRNEILKMKSSGSSFTIMEQGVDEREHSGEMQYPFIVKALQKSQSNKQFKVLPIMCGSLSSSQEEEYGKLLAPIVARPNVLCVISTDFCHWGSRFQYQPTPSSTTTMEIHQHIRELDHQGMSLIEMQEPGAFAKYLKETRNTICGRHAIGVWLNAVHANNPKREVLDIEFVKYDQSSQVRSMRESSVSYGSATARRKT
jgi:AmmeMemoRadiSam system protein B